MSSGFGSNVGSLVVTVAMGVTVVMGVGCTRAPPPTARGGGPPAVERDPTAEDAREVFARIRCSFAASCGGEGDGLDACRARVSADLADWPRCDRIDRDALGACVAAVRDAGCAYSAMPLICAPESLCR